MGAGELRAGGFCVGERLGGVVECGGGVIAALSRFGDVLGQARGLRLGRLDAHPQRLLGRDEPDDALAAVGQRPDLRHVLGFGGAEGIFGLPEDVADGFEALAGLPLGLRQLFFFSGGALGAGLQLFRVLPGPRRRRRIRGAVGGDAAGRAHSLGEGGQPEPQLASGVGPGRDLLQLRFQVIAALGGLLGDRLLRRHLVGDHLGSLGGVGKRRPQGHEIGRRERQPGLPQVSLDRLRAAGGLGLPGQGLELAAELADQVLETVEVGLHRLQLALGLLFATPMLEHAGGFLDEGAALLRARLQDLGQAALADDDVHFAADARIAEQLLDVHETAAGTVDLVFAGAVAEHAAGHRDLGIADGQGPVGVVDGQRHLGAAQRLATRGAGEDDVLHLPAAQGLGALLAHHPRQGVDDVGLAGAVRADDRADARLELQRGRRREGLESFEGQRFEVHDWSFCHVGHPGSGTSRMSAGDASIPCFPYFLSNPA